MMERVAESPKRTARVAGLLLLLTIVAGILAEMVISDSLIVSGDAAATAANIVAHRGLFQLGFALYMIEMASQIAQTALFYYLLRPVSRSVALVAAFLGLAGCTVKILSRLFYISPLLVLGGAHYLSVFSPEQLQALALLSFKINSQGAGIALVFFGFETPLENYLIFKSTFLPRWLGVLGIVGGLGWLTFLYPPLGYRLFMFVALVGIIGALAQIFWLLVFGVNEEKWKERAAAARG